MEKEKMEYDSHIAKEILRIRLSQMIVNEKYKNKEFKIPIHLALGHEAIAVAVNSIIKKEDQLVLSHRNMHYNLARAGSLKPIIYEYWLKKDGLANAQLGSMNLANEDKAIMYASSILGNNMGVATGMALSKKVKKEKGVIIVESGDGAIEEGSFYEGLLFMKSNSLAAIIIIENNDWSLATRICERRCNINVEKFGEALGVPYRKLAGNDVFEYMKVLKEVRKHALENKTPYCVEVILHTLGDWILKNEDYPDGKYVNYHAGPAPTVSLMEWPVIQESNEDPVFALKEYFDEQELRKMAGELFKALKEEIK